MSWDQRVHDDLPHLVLAAAHPGGIGGMEKFCRFLTDTVLAAGWRLTVALSGEDIYSGRSNADCTRLRVDRVDWLDRTFAGDREYLGRRILGRRAWFRRVRPDVALFVQSWNTPMRASVLGAALAGVPIVTTHRTMAWPVESGPPGRYLFGLVRGLGLHRRRLVRKTWITGALARFIVFNSHAVREGYERLYRYPRHKGRVILNAVTAPAFDAAAEARSPNQSDEITIGYVGRVAPEKRLDILLRALADLRTSRRVTLAIHGDGPARTELTRLAGELGLTDRVRWCGLTDDVWSAYRQCDLVVLCSPRESSSNMVLEAMSVGRAAVVTNVGGQPELVGHGKWGVCVPPLDLPALTEALARLIEDRAGREALGAKARAAVLTRHDPGTIRAAWLAILHEAARAGRQTPESPLLNHRSSPQRPIFTAQRRYEPVHSVLE